MAKSKKKPRPGQDQEDRRLAKHQLALERTGRALSPIPVKPTDEMSSHEHKLNNLVIRQHEEAMRLRQLIGDDGAGIGSPFWIDTLQNLLALAFKIDGFRHAFADPGGQIAIPTQEENRRWNEMEALWGSVEQPKTKQV